MKKDLISGQHENQIEDAIQDNRIKSIIKKMKELDVYYDAQRQVEENDFGGIAFLINMCEGKQGDSSVKYGLVFDVYDKIKGVME